MKLAESGTITGRYRWYLFPASREVLRKLLPTALHPSLFLIATSPSVKGDRRFFGHYGQCDSIASGSFNLFSMVCTSWSSCLLSYRFLEGIHCLQLPLFCKPSKTLGTSLFLLKDSRAMASITSCHSENALFSKSGTKTGGQMMRW